MLGKLRDRATTFMKTSKTDSDRRRGGYLAAAALVLHFLKFRGQGLSAAAVGTWPPRRYALIWTRCCIFLVQFRGYLRDFHSYCCKNVLEAINRLDQGLFEQLETSWGDLGDLREATHQGFAVANLIFLVYSSLISMFLLTTIISCFSKS